MTPGEVVVHVVDRDGVDEIFELFGKAIRQSREPPHRHSHRQILALNVARRNLRFVWLAADDVLGRPTTFPRRVARLWLGVVAWVPEVFDELGVVHRAAETGLHRL